MMFDGVSWVWNAVGNMFPGTLAVRRKDLRIAPLIRFRDRGLSREKKKGLQNGGSQNPHGLY